VFNDCYEFFGQAYVSLKFKASYADDIFTNEAAQCVRRIDEK
jgi:hypothetical protein